MRSFFGYPLFMTSAVVGLVKTILVLRVLLDPSAVTWPVTAAVLVVATGLTYLVLLFVVSRLMPARLRACAPETGGTDDLCKERVVAAYAAQWGLSEAEKDVALFVSKGFSNAEIAELRGCAVATVKAQLGSLFRKSGLKNRVQLISLISDEICDQAVDRATALRPEPVAPADPVALPVRAPATGFVAAAARNRLLAPSESIE